MKPCVCVVLILALSSPAGAQFRANVQAAPKLEVKQVDPETVRKARESLKKTPPGATQPAKPGREPVLQANPKPKGPRFTANPVDPGPDSTAPDEREPDYPSGGGGYDPGYDYSGGYEYDYYDPGYYDGGYYYDPGYSEQPAYQEPAAPPEPELPRSHGSLFDNQLGFSEPTEAPSGATPDVPEDDSVEPRQLLVATANMTDAQTLQQQVTAMGYRVRKRSTLRGLGMVVSVLQLPEGKRVRDAAEELRQVLPGFLIDANTRYGLSGADRRRYAARLIGWKPESGHCGANRRVALIDTSVDTGHPALKQARVMQKSLVPGGLKKADPVHGTAVAALLVGTQGEDFAGLIPDAELYVYDVFRKRGKKKTDTTAEWIIRALDQAARQRVDAVNMSLGGPPNALLDVAIRAVVNQQILVVAAAGNGGRNAPPAYPAAYPGVVAVTAVDANRNVYAKANHGDYVEFAAPGVDIWSAKPGGGGHFLSGTSYATPFVTAALVSLRSGTEGEPAQSLHERLAGTSHDLGDPGHDAVYGWGLIQNQAACPQVANAGATPKPN